MSQHSLNIQKTKTTPKGLNFPATAMKSSRFLAVAFWVLLFSPTLVYPIQGQDPALLKERFLQEAPKAWKEYEAFLGTLQGRTTSKMTFAKKPGIGGYLEIKQNSRSIQTLSQEQGEKAPRGELVSCTPEYCFRLSRKSETDPWAMSMLSKSSPESGKPSGLLGEARKLISHQAGCLLRLERTLLSDLIAMPEFQIKTIQPVRFEGADCVEIQFDCSHPIKETGNDPFYPVQRGTMVLDPERSWCLRKADFFCDYSNRKDVLQTLTLKIKDGPNPRFPIPQTEVLSNPNYSSTRELDLAPGSPLPGDAEFTLTAFGFPEPTPPVQPTRWFLWFSIIGVSLIVAGVVLYSRKKNVEQTKP